MPRFPVVSGERRPDMNMTALIVTGDGAGAMIAVSLMVLGLIGIPEARPFFLASALFGGLLGLILYWKHR